MNINRNNIKYAACNSEMYNVFQTNSAYGFSKNRVLARPLSGGVSLGNYLNMYGTLGGLFRDNTDGTIVGLTCRHVCDQMTSINADGNATDRFAVGYPPNYDFLKTRYTSLSDRLDPSFQINTDTVLFGFQYADNYNREYAEIRYNKVYQGIPYSLQTFNRTGLAKNMNIINKPMYQPGYPIFQPTIYNNFINGVSIPASIPGGFNTSRPYPQTIGHIKRVVPLKTDLRYYNEVDSGVIAIEKPFNEDKMLDQNSCNFVGFTKIGGSVFATTREINSLSANPATPLFKTGAGTGSTGFGAIDTSCHTLSFSQFYDFIGVEGVNYSNGIAFSMIDTTGDIRFNLLSASNNFNSPLYGGYWVKPNTLAQDSVDPNNVANNAWSFRMSNATGSPSNNQCGLLVGNRFESIIPDNTDVTVSVWVKADPGLNISDIYLGIGDYSFISIKNKLSTQWQRFSHTGKYRSRSPFSSTGSRGFQLWVVRSGSTNLNHKIYVYGAQLEVGNGMTNYVQTPDNPFKQYNGTKRTNYITASENFAYGNIGAGGGDTSGGGPIVGPDGGWFRTGGNLVLNQGLKNKINNSIGIGSQIGIIGSGGAFPTQWYGTLKSFSGMDTEIVNSGVEDGFNYIDIRIYGNATSQSYMYHNLYTTPNLPASFGQTWTHSMYYKVVSAPTTDNINVIMLLNAVNSSTNYLGEINSGTFLPKNIGSTLTRYSISGTVTQSNVTSITPYLQFNFAAPNQFVDITVRIAAPQAEWGAITPYTATNIISNPMSSSLLSISSVDMTRFTADNFTGTGGDTYLWQRLSNLTPGITGTFSCWMSTPHILSNLLLKSEEFNDAVWIAGTGTTITPNVVAAPDPWFGSVADQVNTTSNIAQPITAKPNTTYTFSVWLRSATGSNQSVTVRLEDSGVVLNQVRSTTTVTISANEWRRVTLSGISQTSTSLFRPSIRNGNYYIWGAQLVEGSLAGDYVRTTNTIIERARVPLVIKPADITSNELASIYCLPASTLNRFAVSAVVPGDGVVSVIAGGYGSIKNNQTIQLWGAQFEESSRPTNYIQTFNSPTTAYTTETIPLSTLEGDSGSMLWALLSSTSPTASAWKIVGQIFAYSNNPLPVIGYASRIDKIQQALDISPWDGTNIVYTPGSPKYFTAFSVDEVTTKMGRKCYRVSNTDTISASYNLQNFSTPPIPI